MHSGNTASAGHYWAYINDLIADPERKICANNNQWLKFNDAEVTVVPEQQVFDDGSGTDSSSTSAYCLIYVDVERCQFGMKTFVLVTLHSANG